jgi:hypothetical protein
MADLTGIGPVATLIDTILSWLMDPAGYAKLTREHKLKVFNDALLIAVQNNDMAAADLIYGGLRRMLKETA